jgi:hypothetical protein
LVELQRGNLQREQAARALAVILWNGIGRRDDLQGLRALSSWAEAACVESSGEFTCASNAETKLLMVIYYEGPIALLEPLARGKTYLFTLRKLAVRSLQFIARDSS